MLPLHRSRSLDDGLLSPEKRRMIVKGEHMMMAMTAITRRTDSGDATDSDFSESAEYPNERDCVTTVKIRFKASVGNTKPTTLRSSKSNYISNLNNNHKKTMVRQRFSRCSSLSTFLPGSTCNSIIRVSGTTTKIPTTPSPLSSSSIPQERGNAPLRNNNRRDQWRNSKSKNSEIHFFVESTRKLLVEYDSMVNEFDQNVESAETDDSKNSTTKNNNSSSNKASSSCRNGNGQNNRHECLPRDTDPGTAAATTGWRRGQPYPLRLADSRRSSNSTDDERKTICSLLEDYDAIMADFSSSS